MPGEPVSQTATVTGMVCAACAARINKRLAAEPGVVSAEAEYQTNSLTLQYDRETVSWDRLTEILDRMGFRLSAPPTAAGGGVWRTAGQIGGTLVVAGAVYWLAARSGLLTLFNVFPRAESGSGVGMIFLIGVLTSAHCLAMCGGINLSQTALSAPRRGRAAAAPVILYGAGRVASYTAVGALVGGLGSVLSLSPGGQGLVQIAAGVFMALMGLNLLGLFPWLRRIIPHLPQSWSRKAGGGPGRGPLYVGLLNGFMPCGPLQTMQLFALSTGSPVDGALAMFAFAVGTLPLTMGLGMLASYLGRKFMGSAIRVGAVLVFLMGLAMLGNGLSLSGYVRPSLTGGAAPVEAVVSGGVQTLATVLRPDAYPALRVRAGVPVVWRITAAADDINGCNNRFFIPEYGIDHSFVAGENVVEFTPERAGVFPYMCWMGMIASRIVVGDAADSGVVPEFDASRLPAEEPAADIPWLE